MMKSEKRELQKWTKGLSNDELETEYYRAIYDSLGSETEEMHERGYDIQDIKEREAYERSMISKVDIIEKECIMRGIKIWEAADEN